MRVTIPWALAETNSVTELLVFFSNIMLNHALPNAWQARVQISTEHKRAAFSSLKPSLGHFIARTLPSKDDAEEKINFLSSCKYPLFRGRHLILSCLHSQCFELNKQATWELATTPYQAKCQNTWAKASRRVLFSLFEVFATKSDKEGAALDCIFTESGRRPFAAGATQILAQNHCQPAPPHLDKLPILANTFFHTWQIQLTTKTNSIFEMYTNL